MSEKDHKHYNSSKNIARDVEEVKKTRMYIERKDGTNISGVIIPHDAQVGLDDDNFRSDLGIKGDLKVDGTIKGSIQKLSDGLTDFIQAGSSIIVVNNADGSITISASEGEEEGGGSGGGGTKVVYRSQQNIQGGTPKLLTWAGSAINGLGNTATGNPKAWLIAPFSGNLVSLQVAIKSNSGNYAGMTQITLDVFKNVDGSGSRSHTISTDIGCGGGTDEFTLKLANVDGASSNYYFAARSITLPISQGDLLQIQAQRVGGSNVDATVSVVLEES